MSTEPFIGEIKIFGFNFAPISYATCAGQILSIAQNTALFSLIGTTYGGNGIQTFGLPNLQSRVPIGAGTNYIIGQQSGAISASISISNMPAHNHPATGISINVPVSQGGADTNSPTNAFLANAKPGFYASATNDSSAAVAVSGATGISGSSIPFDIENPYLTVNYSIATQGIFPSRN
ncbi:tail fiber protein [Flavobacterium sp.]|uniref:phage tail protein n=1 Tax=Flavobacterium sp. TaxID=239 RepID=UPI001B5FD469|nr:tail fiber protein [Flavobacterium sp.]MBP6181427.1 phage tail protein [Flavobacterium sp.]